jgi:hypothetical protein
MVLIFQKAYWSKFVGLSFLVHLFFYYLLSLSVPDRSSNSFNLEQALKGKKVTPVNMDLINKETLENIRKLKRLGVKNGQKEFSVPMGKNPVKELKKSETSTSIESNPKVNLKALGANVAPDLKTKKQTDAKANRKGVVIRKWKEQSHAEVRLSSQDRRDQREMKQTFMNRIQSNEGIFQAMEKSDLNIKFAPPDGVPEDELNSLEKKFFSFQKRTYTSYINNFINQFNQLSVTKPNLKNNLLGYQQHLSARATFDKNGDIVSIKVLRWSDFNDVQLLFENTIEAIHSLPNPPVEMLDKNDEFSIYFTIQN